MKPEAKIRGITGMHIVRKILSEVPVPVIQQGWLMLEECDSLQRVDALDSSEQRILRVI